MRGATNGLKARSEKPDNKELMALIVERNREALETLYDRYAGGVYSLALGMLRDPGAGARGHPGRLLQRMEACVQLQAVQGQRHGVALQDSPQ